MTNSFSAPPAQRNVAHQECEDQGTALDVSPLAGSRQVARFVHFLHHEVHAPEVDLEPQPDERYQFRLAITPAQVIQALLDSTEFRPASLRSFASGALVVRLAGGEPIPAPDGEESNPNREGPQQTPAPRTEASPPPENESRAPAAGGRVEPESAQQEADGNQLLQALARLAHALDEAPAVGPPSTPEPPASNAGEAAPSPAGAEEAERPADALVAEADATEVAHQPVPEGRENGAPPVQEPVFLRDTAASSPALEDPEAESLAGEAAQGVQLVARPFSNFGQLNRFITAIGGLPDVRSVALRRFRDGTLWLAVDCVNTGAFSARLRAQREIPIEIVSEGEGTIEVAVREESRQAASI